MSRTVFKPSRGVTLTDFHKFGTKFHSFISPQLSRFWGDAIWFLVVAALWGGTNPFIKQGGKGIDKINKSNAIFQFFAELKFLIFNWKYLIPFLLNQSGSVIFYLTLASADISLAAPITNSLTFIFTAISANILGERLQKETILGMLFVAAGAGLCVMAKVTES